MAKKTRTFSRAPLTWLLCGGSLCTLFFWSALADPFNAPKSWILSVAGFWLLGWVVFQIGDQWQFAPLKWATVISGGFAFALTLDFIIGSNKYISFFGEYGRRTGYLSYMALTIFFLSASFLIHLGNVERLAFTVLITGFIVAAYGLLQYSKNDFINWNNPYNPIISSLGNPDFAAAAMSMFLIVSFGVSMQSKYHLWLRVFAGFNTALLAGVIYLTHVLQGLITSVLGVIIILIVWVHQKRKFLAYGLSVFSICLGITSIFAMLNHGPLAKFFYKPSVIYRGDYWRAGWRMFIQHPLFGVGLDRYGAYFRQYRDATQSLRRGPGLVSNGAHNIPIQLAATGGILLLLAYLGMTLFVASRGIVALKRVEGEQQILVATILGAWIAYTAQSLISIDNLAIAIWGYILGGTIIGISTSIQNSGRPKVSIYRQVLPGSLALVFVIVSAIFWAEQNSAGKVLRQPNPKNQTQLQVYKEISQKPFSFVFKEPQIEFVASAQLAQIGEFSTAVAELEKLVQDDPRNFNAQDFLAKIYEYQKNWSTAIQVRQRIAKLDPFNQINLLQLGEDYKSSGDISAAKTTLVLIDSFAPSTTEALQALKDFGK